MTLDWHFKKGGSGSINADSMADPLRNTYLSLPELLVRESLQNSVDEAIDRSEGLKFRIEAKKLTGDAKLSFLKKLKFNHLLSKAKLFEDANNWFDSGGEIMSQFEAPEVPLRILVVSDHKCNGLGGKWYLGQEVVDRFFSLVLSLTKSKKQQQVQQDGGARLGSYGYGKMVYALSSKLRTMVYYSHFPNDERAGDHNKRLMATAFLPSYYVEEEEMEYAGQAYFGYDSGRENNPKKPLVNDDADRFYTELGFNPREPGDYGTSVVLPACDFSISEIGQAIEKWWWPLLTLSDLGSKLQIELIEDDGSAYELNPQQRSDLNPFIQALRNLNENTTIEKKAETKEVQIRVPNTLVPGSVSCLRLPKNSEIELKNCTAFIRDNLVIEYWDKAFSEEGVGSVGVFAVSDEVKKAEIKRIITFSEPPAHDRWFEYLDRLTTVYGNYGSDVVRQTKNQIAFKCKDFQLRLEQQADLKESDALGFLDDILGPLIKQRKGGPPTPLEQPDPRPYTMEFNSEIVEVDGVHYSELRYKIGLKKEADVEEADCDLELVCAIVGDDVMKATDKLDVIILGEDGHPQRVLRPGESSTIKVRKESRTRGTARSRIHPRWITAWKFFIDRAGEQNDPSI